MLFLQQLCCNSFVDFVLYEAKRNETKSDTTYPRQWNQYLLKEQITHRSRVNLFSALSCLIADFELPISAISSIIPITAHITTGYVRCFCTTWLERHLFFRELVYLGYWYCRLRPASCFSLGTVPLMDYYNCASFDCRHITYCFFVRSKNNSSSTYVFMRWKQWWVAGSLNNLYKV
jgi:hypothetical protein